MFGVELVRLGCSGFGFRGLGFRVQGLGFRGLGLFKSGVRGLGRECKSSNLSPKSLDSEPYFLNPKLPYSGLIATLVNMRNLS